MWQVAVLYSVVLFSATLADGQPCDSDGPDNCTFNGSLSSCSWSFNTTVWNYDRSSAVFGTDSSSKAIVISKTACSTGGDTHCLKIRHFFEGDNNTGLNVFFKDQGEDRNLVCGSGSADRALNVSHDMYLNITTRKNFEVILEARKETEGNGKLFIEDIIYSKAPCSVLKSNTWTPSLDTQFCTYATTDNINSHETGVVIGVVVSVIIVGIAVVIFILYRRKKLHIWMTCFINAKKKDTTGTSQNGRCYVGKDGKRAANGVNATQTVPGHNNHAFPASESQPSDTYYSVIKDTDRSGDSAGPHYSTIQESQSAYGKILTNSSKCTDNDPYEIEAKNGHLTSKSAATRHANANKNLKGKTVINGNPLPPASNGGNRQAPSDFYQARGTGDEATRVYHCLEEDPTNHGDGGTIGLYHYAKDPGINPEAGADATGVYHILEEDPANPRDSQLVGIYSVHQDGKMGHLQNPAVKASKGQNGNYNTLDFAGNNACQKINEDASGGVYNHLNAGNDDPYNEVDREKRAEVIDGEYSHIK